MSRLHSRDCLAECSPREQQLIAALARGLSDKEIGVEMGISEKTVHQMFTVLRLYTGTSNRVTVLRYFYDFVERKPRPAEQPQQQQQQEPKEAASEGRSRQQARQRSVAQLDATVRSAIVNRAGCGR